MTFSKLLWLLGFVPGAAACRRAVARSRPTLEALEDRTLLSAGVSVLTYNLNEGTDFTPLLNAQTPQAVPAAVSAVWAEVQASDIPDRAQALAQVIAEAHPTLAGLQEAVQYTVNGNLKYDLLGSLLDDLAALGQHYGLAVVSPTFAAQAPDLQGEVIGFQDENVILARTDLPAERLTLSDAQLGLFTARVGLPIGGVTLPITRSWAAVDVTSGGQTFRFITAHLEDFDPNVRLAQANELLSGPASTALPVVLGGDFNSPAGGQGLESAAYNTLIAGGFTDAWSQAHPHDPGFTDGTENVANTQRDLTVRIDVILTRGGLSAHHVELVGNQPEDRTPAGLWPSDHNGVAATIRFSNHDDQEDDATAQLAGEVARLTGDGRSPASRRELAATEGFTNQ
jgi:endonuclease/exonuclease/phosphatase family metal-dependent hydrolase